MTIRPTLLFDAALLEPYLGPALAGRDWLMGGDEPTGADVMLSFVGEIAVARADMSRLPNIAAWVKRFQARPAYVRALEKGGPYSFAAA